MSPETMALVGLALTVIFGLSSSIFSALQVYLAFRALREQLPARRYHPNRRRYRGRRRVASRWGRWIDRTTKLLVAGRPYLVPLLLVVRLVLAHMTGGDPWPDGLL